MKLSLSNSRLPLPTYFEISPEFQYVPIRAAPIEYGANAVAGAIDLISFVPREGSNLRAEAQQGSLGRRNVNVLAGMGLDNGWSFVAGGSLVDRDADRIADKDSIVFDPSMSPV